MLKIIYFVFLSVYCFTLMKRRGNMASSILLAHIDINSHRTQTLAAHSENAAELCGQFCEKIGLKSLGLVCKIKKSMLFNQNSNGG